PTRSRCGTADARGACSALGADAVQDRRRGLAIHGHAIVLLILTDRRGGVGSHPAIGRAGVVAQTLEPGLDIAHGGAAATGAAPVDGPAQIDLARCCEDAGGATYRTTDQGAAHGADRRDGADHGA